MYGFYLCDFNPYDSSGVPTGVDRKVIAQIDCFNSHGLNCSFIHAERPRGNLLRGVGSLPIMPDLINWPSVGELHGASYLYIRRPLFASREFLSFLKSFKEANPNAIVILELPTYPYDPELKIPVLLFAYAKDKKYRRRYSSYVDYIADLSGAKKIFDVPTLHIFNGLDLNDITVRKPSIGKSSVINIVQAANFSPWHGTDLLIQGLHDYYQSGGTREINLHLAGEGSEYKKLRCLVTDSDLSSRVHFYGMLDKQELYGLYDKCSLGVGCLAMHRRDVKTPDSSLKTREYLAKGMPFIYSGTVDVLGEQEIDFCLRFRSNEDPIDFYKVVNFYDGLYLNYGEIGVIDRIRSYANNTISIDRAMKSVIDECKQHAAYSH